MEEFSPRRTRGDTEAGEPEEMELFLGRGGWGVKPGGIRREGRLRNGPANGYPARICAQPTGESEHFCCRGVEVRR